LVVFVHFVQRSPLYYDRREWEAAQSRTQKWAAIGLGSSARLQLGFIKIAKWLPQNRAVLASLKPCSIESAKHSRRALGLELTALGVQSNSSTKTTKQALQQLLEQRGPVITILIQDI
jgi:hypothetical protein